MQGLDADHIRHVVITIDDGHANTTIREESWMRSDGSTNQMTTGAIEPTDVEIISLGAQNYINPYAQQKEDWGEDAPMDFPQVRLPDGVEGSIGIDPLTDTTSRVCATFAPGKTPQTIETLLIIDEVLEYLNPRTASALPDVGQALDILQTSGLVVDLGESQSNEFGTVRTFRLSYEDTHSPDAVITRGVDFIFEATSLRFRQMHSWYENPDLVNEGTMNMTIVTDEILSSSQVDSRLFDPVARGLVVFDPSPLYSDESPYDQQTVIPETGCYIFDEATAP